VKALRRHARRELMPSQAPRRTPGKV